MKKILWKSYTCFLIFLFVISFLLACFTPNIVWIEYAPRMIAVMFSLIGLYGFVWKKAFGKQWLWKAVFFSLVLIFVWIRLRGFNIAEMSQENYSIVGNIARYAIGISSIAPLFYGLFSYAFRSPKIWSKTEVSEPKK